MNLSWISQLAFAIQSHSSKRSRKRSERSREANRVRYRRNLLVGEKLEDRALLAGLIGTHNIGPTGEYASIGAAISAIQSSGLDGPVTLELQPTYVSTVETFPLVFTNLGTTVVNTLTLRPETGATNLSITSSDTTAATVDLNAAQFVTVDGRPGGMGSHSGSGVGTASQLTIENTSTSGVAVRFINEASNNNIYYTTIRGVNTSFSSGLVVFGTTTGTNGNDNNTLDHCDIRDGVTTPKNSLYSAGSTSTTQRNNSGNAIVNSNIYNFYGSISTTGVGVNLLVGNTDWSIIGNSFYQTATRVAGSVIAISVTSSGVNNVVVTGNFIGGSAPNAGGTAWTTTGTSSASTFTGISLSGGYGTPNSVQGNTIANMVWTSSDSSTLLWRGISVEEGRANIGTTSGNTIGSGTGTSSISVTTAGNGGTTIGIYSSSFGSGNIANNTIGSMTVNGTSTSVSASLYGIVSRGTIIIENNTLGSATTANSLNAATSSTSTTEQQVIGVFIDAASVSTRSSITGNTVANLNNNYAGTNGLGHVRGIAALGGISTIIGNIVRNLSTTSQNANVGSGQSVSGIAVNSTSAGQTISQNTVHSVANTAASAIVSVTGIYFAGSTSGTNIIARNLVHSLAASSTHTSSRATGMQFDAGTFIAQNNMVRVGLKADGTGTAATSVVRGIYDNGTSAGRNFFHNSVYVGGIATAGAGSLAFQSSGVTNTRSFQNNIFVNARSGGTGRHTAVSYGGSGVNPTGLTAGGNIFMASSGTGGTLGLYNGVLTTLAAWQAATGQDTTSFNVNPLFINPTGTAATVDLHLQNTSPAANTALVLTSVTNDFDGHTRSLITPDIGADEFFNSPSTSVSLSPDFASLAENTSTASAIELSTITIIDDSLGTNTLALSGTDAGSFEIVAGKLRLKSGVVLDFETKPSYTVRVNVDDTTVGGTPDAFADFTLSITDVNPPTVTGVFVSGSTWSTTFIDAVDGGGTGAGNGLGYALTPELTLSNSGVDRIYIQFSEPMVGFSASSFKLLGADTADYAGLSGVSYDSINNRGVIQLSSSINRDKLRIGVSDSITNASLLALDGDTNDTPGGIFDFRFNVLVGDADGDGSVNGSDLPLFASSFNLSTGSIGYNSRADWNHDGSVNGGDLHLFANNYNQSLPLSDPGPITFPPPPEESYAPVIEIDEYFSGLDDKEWFALEDSIRSPASATNGAV